MWRKILAALCVPVVVLLAWSIPATLRTTLAQLRPGASTGYKAGYLIGMSLACAVTVLVIFFLSRWILRSFRKPLHRSV